MLSSIRAIITLKTALVTALAVLATYLATRYNLAADFPLTLVGIAVVFPLVFSISGAYKRREVALGQYGSIKGHGRAIYFAARDRMEPDPETLARARQLLFELLDACRDLFRTPVKRMAPQEERVYQSFSDLSGFVKSFRTKGLASGEVSRCNQYLSKMLIAFENVKHIYQYRTPRTLRAYSALFIYLLPIVYPPYFAEIARDFAAGLTYVMPVLFTVVLVSLENIQEHLENPFDQIGEDDVMINAEKFIERLSA
jgi:predicted membrane chloride channel (bestrophin family)